MWQFLLCPLAPTLVSKCSTHSSLSLPPSVKWISLQEVSPLEHLPQATCTTSAIRMWLKLPWFQPTTSDWVFLTSTGSRLLKRFVSTVWHKLWNSPAAPWKVVGWWILVTHTLIPYGIKVCLSKSSSQAVITTSSCHLELWPKLRPNPTALLKSATSRCKLSMTRYKPTLIKWCLAACSCNNSQIFGSTTTRLWSKHSLCRFQILTLWPVPILATTRCLLLRLILLMYLLALMCSCPCFLMIIRMHISRPTWDGRTMDFSRLICLDNGCLLSLSLVISTPKLLNSTSPEIVPPSPWVPLSTLTTQFTTMQLITTPSHHLCTLATIWLAICTTPHSAFTGIHQHRALVYQ